MAFRDEFGMPRCPECGQVMEDNSSETEYDFKCDCGVRISGEFEA